jgi:biotin carboxylase
MASSVRHILVIDANMPGIDTIRQAKRLGHRVSFIRSTNSPVYPDNEETRATLATVDRLVEVSLSSNLAQVAPVACQIHVEKPVDAILCQEESCIETAAEIAELLGVRYTSLRGIKNARNKARARELLAQAGLSSAKYALVHNVEEARLRVREIGFPVIVKPVSGLDSILASAANTPDELEAAVNSLQDGVNKLPEQLRELFSRGILLEERLSGPLISAEIGFLDGQPFEFMISGRTRALEDETIELGAFMPAAIGDEQRSRCFDYARRVCQLIGLDYGIFHIELILTERGPVMVEANPRLMGGIMPSVYQHVTGVNIHDYLIAIHLGDPPPAVLPYPQCCVTTRKIMAKNAGRLSGSIHQKDLERFGGKLIQFNLNKAGGSEVGRREIVGRFQVKESDIVSATAVANQILDALEAGLGMELLH